MKSIEDIMKEEDMPIEKEKKDWLNKFFPPRGSYGFEEVLGDLLPEEKAVLRKKYEDEDYYDYLEQYYDELDEGALYDLSELYLPELTSEMKSTPRKQLTFGSFKSYSIQKTGEPVYITEKAFNQLREIAWRELLHRNAEAAAFVYGKKGVITKAKQYLCKGSPGLVSGNAMDVVKQMQKKGFMGVFHSHTFNSASPSGTDRECLNGWTNYAREFGIKDPLSLIGCLPYFKQRCYSLNEKLDMQEHEVIILDELTER